MSLPTAVSHGYAYVVFGTVGLAVLLGAVAGFARPGGMSMKSSRPRLWVGLSVIALAALVGAVGWFRISGEPLLNRQIPFLASAGLFAVLLAVVGGALVVSEQLKGDQSRIEELENAVKALTEALAPVIEAPPRIAPAALQLAGEPTAKKPRVSSAKKQSASVG
jgi:hypothetical protein